MDFLVASTEGMFGLITNVFATFIVIFVILGAFLEKDGARGRHHQHRVPA